ncbi:hypothetical protein AB0L85_28055 [Streptomyces sp. NPDC052051]|uniref:hypothetical protein n=1 Tax=Streptomyces sp. NPDC052051 TaxID=3154649 RepID=UPI00342375FE
MTTDQTVPVAATVHHVIPGCPGALAAALKAASPGDEVRMAAGTYEETLRVARDVTLRAADGGGVVLAAPPVPPRPSKSCPVPG